jgi:hypothetical protein
MQPTKSLLMTPHVPLTVGHAVHFAFWQDEKGSHSPLMKPPVLPSPAQSAPTSFTAVQVPGAVVVAPAQ